MVPVFSTPEGAFPPKLSFVSKLNSIPVLGTKHANTTNAQHALAATVKTLSPLTPSLPRTYL